MSLVCQLEWVGALKRLFKFRVDWPIIKFWWVSYWPKILLSPICELFLQPDPAS